MSDPYATFHVALVGCGRWGENILRELRRFRTKVSVVERAEDRRARARDLGVEIAVEQFDELPDVDGIIVATPASTHRTVLEQALGRGKPVFSEKPFVLKAEDATALAACGARELLSVMHVWRYHAAVEKLAEVVKTGNLGRPCWIRSWRCNWTSPRTDCDSIWTLLPHDVSIFLEITGSVPTASAAWTELSGDQAVGMLARFEGVCPCIAEVSTRFDSKRREIRVHCEEGVAVMRDDLPEIAVFRGDARTPQLPAAEVISVDPTPALRREIEAFLVHLGGGPRPRSTYRDACSITEAVLAARSRGGLCHE